MKTFFTNVWRFIRQPLPAVLLGVLILLLIINTVAFGGSSLENYDTKMVTRQDVVQEVNVTGRVEPVEELNLALERGGRVVAAPVRVGDRVVRGQLLVTVSAGTLGANRAAAMCPIWKQPSRL